MKKVNKGKQYEQLMKDFKLDDTHKYTQVGPHVKFDHVKELIPPLKDYNHMADLIFLPETNKGFKYLLTVVDLWSDELDFEPLKTKESGEVLQALKTIYKRPYLSLPHATLATDDGTEFKSVFHKYLYDKSVYHKVAIPGRHKQQGNIENLNRLINKFLTAYMNKITKQKKQEYFEWTDILDELRKRLNKIRKREDEDPFTYKHVEPDMNRIPKFKVGDIVIRKLDVPKNYLNNKESGKFREGDLRWDFHEPRAVLKVFHYPRNIRYLIEGFPEVSYTEDELMMSEEQESKFAVKALIGKKMINKKVHYLVWYKGELKKDAIWIPMTQLLEDGFEEEIQEFNSKK